MGNYISKFNNLKAEEIDKIQEGVLHADSLKRMKESIRNLVIRNVYSDLIVICGNDRYPCHRAVLCMRSDWFAEACGQLESPLELADGNYAHVVAAVITYLYCLDYGQSEQLLTWSIPLYEDDEFAVEANEELVEAVKSPDAESTRDEYDLVDEIYSRSDSHQTLNANDANSQLPIGAQQSANEHGAEFSQAKDTSLQPSPLIFHAQVFCAALKLGIPCLAKVAKHRCANRLRSKDISDDELLGAVPKIFRPDMLFVPAISFNSIEEGYLDGKFADMQNGIVQIVRKRFPEIKENTSFEEVVITCPEFGRDILRLL